MSEVLETITDASRFGEIFEAHFRGKDVYVKKNEWHLKIEYQDFQDGIITVHSAKAIESSENLLIMARHDDIIVCSRVNCVSSENEVYRYKPVNIQFIKIPRKEVRKSVAALPEDQRHTVFISAIVTDFQIRDTLAYQTKKIENIKDLILDKVRDRFAYSRIFFTNEKTNDLRMLYFNANRSPLFLPDLKECEKKEDRSDVVKYYEKNIYRRDQHIEWNKVKSEISVPIMYKYLLPFGYVQVNNSAVATDEEFSSLKKLCRSIADIIMKNNIIQPSDDRLSIADLSPTGISIVFNKRVFIKHFKDNSLLTFTLSLPEEKSVSMLGRVRHITMIGSNIFKIGCEIVDMDALGEANYQDFLEIL